MHKLRYCPVFIQMFFLCFYLLRRKRSSLVWNEGKNHNYFGNIQYFLRASFLDFLVFVKSEREFVSFPNLNYLG